MKTNFVATILYARAFVASYVSYFSRQEILTRLEKNFENKYDRVCVVSSFLMTKHKTGYFSSRQTSAAIRPDFPGFKASKKCLIGIKKLGTKKITEKGEWCGRQDFVRISAKGGPFLIYLT